MRVVINPVSGTGRRHCFVATLLRRLRVGDRTVEVRWTRAPGDVHRLASASHPRADVLLAIGGDGTVREAAEALAGSSTALAVAPTGTENLFAKHLGFRADVARIAAAVESGEAVRVDVARAGERAFVVVAGVGFDAEVVRRLERRRRGHIHQIDYAMPLYRTLAGHRFPELRVEVDDDLLFEGPGLALVGNVPRYALNLPVFPLARGDDGLLDVCVFDCRGPGELLVHAARTALGKQIGSRGVHYRQARRVRIGVASPTPFELDGDYAGIVGDARRPVLELGIARGALRVAVA